MWTRKELKERAKKVFQLNYWKTVLVALLMVTVIGGGSGSAGALSGSVSGAAQSSVTIHQNEAGDEVKWDDNILSGDEEAVPELSLNENDAVADSSIPPVMGAAMIAFIAIFLLVILAVSIAVGILLLNPLQVGANRFFNRNLNEKAQIRELVFGFDHSYLNVVKIMFLKGLFEGLWTLLLIVPGIIKSYEYRMIPYLLAENPEMSKDEAFARSKEMMDGNKLKAFMLDLSFIPWNLVSVITLGIAGVFFVNPYILQTNAALYDALKTERYGIHPENDYVDPVLSDPLASTQNHENI